jgi:hypothetical protein
MKSASDPTVRLQGCSINANSTNKILWKAALFPPHRPILWSFSLCNEDLWKEVLNSRSSARISLQFSKHLLNMNKHIIKKLMAVFCASVGWGCSLNELQLRAGLLLAWAPLPVPPALKWSHGNKEEIAPLNTYYSILDFLCGMGQHLCDCLLKSVWSPIPQSRKGLERDKERTPVIITIRIRTQWFLKIQRPCLADSSKMALGNLGELG